MSAKDVGLFVRGCFILVLGMHALTAFVCAAESTVPRRAMYVSMAQSPQVLSSHLRIKQLVDDAKSMRMDVIFVQVYQNNQSWFASHDADDSRYQKVVRWQSLDPLLVLIQEAHRQGIKVHAWLSLLNLAGNDQAKILKKFGPKILTENVKYKSRLEDYKIDNQYFLEPSHPDVQKELLAIIAELIKGYPSLDGIQFDYIRYPDVDPHYGYSPHNIAEFKKVTGHRAIDDSSFVWKDWKRKSVTKLLKTMVSQVRRLNPKLEISALGIMPHARAYDEAFQDWAYWVDNGIVDFLSLRNEAKDVDAFNRSVDEVEEKVKNLSKVIISVEANKVMNDQEQWVDLLNSCLESSSGCAVFEYGSLLKGTNLIEMLSSSESQ